jgi:hypothetical protein
MTEPATLKRGKWDDSEAEKASARYVELGSTPEAVEKVAKELGRTTRSVQGKLTTMGVYQVPEKKPAAKKDDGPTKGEILKAITDMGFDTEGLDSATKPAIQRVHDFVASAQSGD